MYTYQSYQHNKPPPGSIDVELSLSNIYYDFICRKNSLPRKFSLTCNEVCETNFAHKRNWATSQELHRKWWEVWNTKYGDRQTMWKCVLCVHFNSPFILQVTNEFVLVILSLIPFTELYFRVRSKGSSRPLMDILPHYPSCFPYLLINM